MRRPPFNASNFFLFGVGVMSAAASFLILGQINSPRHPSESGWYETAITLLIFGGAAIAWGLFAAVVQAREDRKTPLEIEHDPNDPECRQVRPAEGDWQLRVRVRNRGRYGLNRVRARLETAGGYSHWLRLEHDNTEPFHRSIEGEILPADESYWLYFDVGFMNRGGQTFIEYADSYLRDTSFGSEPVDHPITIKVWAVREGDGRTVPPATAHFRFRSWNEIGAGNLPWPKAELVFG